MTEPENQAEALKPCPHCGSKAWLRDSAAGRSRIECDECQTGQLHFADHTEAIAAWNRRASVVPEAPAVPVVKALEWIEAGKDGAVGAFVAPSVLGTYMIWPRGVLETPPPSVSKNYGSVEAAKAGAQADFEARIGSALQSSPPVKAAAVDGDQPETVERNPKSWAAWKRKAEELQATIDEMWTQFDRLRDAVNRRKCGQPFMVGGRNVAPWGIVDHAIAALDLSMMRGDRIEDQQKEIDRLKGGST